MKWIYLSPHLDDVALSLGGLLWEQAQAGDQVEIWTICAGNPPPGNFSPFAASLHDRWGTGASAISARRAEDRVSSLRLGARSVHFAIPDCIYRRSPLSGQHLYASEEALWEPVHPDEALLIQQISAQIRAKLPVQAQIVCPMALGLHVDHRLTRAAIEQLGQPLLYFADYPYVLNEDIERLKTRPSEVTWLSNQGLSAWQEAVAAHQSQISTFWKDLDAMRAAILAYHKKMGGVRLFSRAKTKPFLER